MIDAKLNPGHEPGLAVLDTNVWLDWLVFADPQVGFIDGAPVPLASCDTTRAELAGVLARSHFALDSSRQQALLGQFDRRVSRFNGRHLVLPTISMTRLRCSDRDDQKFLELAVVSGARYLLTRDKALLKLRKKARREHRLAIMAPGEFAPLCDD